MVVIKEKVLYSSVSSEEVDNACPSLPTHFFDYFFAQIRSKTDMNDVFLINGVADLNLGSVYGRNRFPLLELEPRCRRAAARLNAIGFKSGHKMHIALPSTVEFYVPLIGALLNNGVVSMGDPTMNVSNMSRQLRSLDAKVVVCSEENLEIVKQSLIQSGLEKVHLFVMAKCGSNKSFLDDSNWVYDFDTFVSNKDPDVSTEPPELEAPCFVLWSSGTTGNPKGIVHCWNTLWKCFDSPATFSCHTFHPVVLTTTCQFHIGGFIIPIATIQRGRMVIFMDSDAMGDRTETLFEAITKYEPGTMIVGSHHCGRVAFYDEQNMKKEWKLDSVIEMIPTGSTVPANTLTHLRRKMPNIKAIQNMYGTTELAVMVTKSESQECLGPVTSGCVARIEDVQTKELLGAHQRGELVVKSSRKMLYYLDMPEETNKVMLEDGFIRTGDCCYYDEQGNLYFESRLKDLIKVENHHLQPIEVERVLETHPSVLEAAVFGRPDPFYQELVTALIILRPNCDLSKDSLLNWANSRLEKHKMIRGGVTFVRELPRGRTGKLLRRGLEQMWNNEQERRGNYN